jgi:hypothetical protein
MEIASIVVASMVLSTADLCANPIEGGVGEPQFCRLDASQQIDTPLLSLVVDSTFLVGVDRSGRRLWARPSLSQSQVHVILEAVPIGETARADVPQIDQYLKGELSCSPKVLGATTWDWCKGNPEKDDYSEMYFLRTSKFIVVIAHYSSKLGESLTPAVDRLLETVTVHGI